MTHWRQHEPTGFSRYLFQCQQIVNKRDGLINKFRLPGGPKRRRPRAGERSPVKSSGLRDGRITIS